MIYADPSRDLQEIFDTAQPGETIQLAGGDYRCKTVIRTPGLTLCGAGADSTRIIWDDYAKKPDADGVEYNTFRTWTLAVCADGITMKDLCIVNDALHPEIKGQEVALTVYGDRFTMERCRLTSTQDTLFLGPLPFDLIARYDGFLPDCLRRDKPCAQRFDHCLIEGTVDFIFGCGSAVFDRCEIRSLYDVRGTGYAAAPAHAPEQTKGFLFRNCRFTAGEGVPPGSVYLARPWRDYGLCTFQDCSYGDHISPLGFDKWNDTERDKTARFYETPPVLGRAPWVRDAPSGCPWSIPRRPADGHKGDFGKLFILAGSLGYTGAAALCARAAVRGGAGLVTVAVPEEVYPIVAVECDEAMVRPWPADDGELVEMAQSCGAAVIGPGLGRSGRAEQLVLTLMRELPCPVILDADGLNIISGHIDVLDEREGQTVLTPHEGEFARLSGCELPIRDRVEAARDFAAAHHCTVVLKGRHTITAPPSGEVRVNTTGNPGMAKGGSGDALAGLMGALTVQKLSDPALAVWLHGRAGDLAAEDKGEYGMTPSDLIGQIPYAIRELEE